MDGGEFKVEESEHSVITLYSHDSPGIPIAFFGGPWLPQSYDCEAVKYFQNLDYPLQILEDADRRDRIVEAIIDLSEESQMSLFDGRYDGVQRSLDDLMKIKKGDKLLYNHWVKENGVKLRDIDVPKNELRYFLERYVKPIVMQFPCHDKAHGGELGWNPRRSLETHLPIGTVLSFDMENAFRQIEIQHVFDLFYRNLEGRLDDDVARDVSGFITSLTTVKVSKYTNILPQGAPLSMAIFNRILHPVDELMDKGAKKRNLRYSRWVDDFIISAPESNRNIGKLFGAVTIMREDFPISVHKTFLQQDKPWYYLLGHKLSGKTIIKADEEEIKANRGEPVHKDAFITRLEHENAWVTDYEEYVDEDFGIGGEDLPF